MPLETASSQADSAGSIPVTRSTREQQCSTSESGAVRPVGQRSPASEISTRAITSCHYHPGKCPYPSSASFGLVLVSGPPPIECPVGGTRQARCTQCAVEGRLLQHRGENQSSRSALSRTGRILSTVHRPDGGTVCGLSLFCRGGWITGTCGVSVVRCPEEGLTYQGSLLEQSSFGASLVTAYRAL